MNYCAGCNIMRCCDVVCAGGCDVYFNLCTKPYASPTPAATIFTVVSMHRQAISLDRSYFTLYYACACSTAHAHNLQFFWKSSAAYSACPTADPGKFFRIYEVKQIVECKKTIHDASKTKVSVHFTFKAKVCNTPFTT